MVHFCMTYLMTHHSHKLVSIGKMLNQCITDHTMSVATKPIDKGVAVAASFINDKIASDLAPTCFRRIRSQLVEFWINCFQFLVF